LYDFIHLDLHRQCDQALMLGGVGIEACTRPKYTSFEKHADWTHRKLMPASFVHGAGLIATCWNERYRGVWYWRKRKASLR
jgi:hypothetical protein